MPETFTQYLKRWLSHSTVRGLNNPLVKMPVKRFLKLQPLEFDEFSRGGSRIIGTTSEPIARNLLKNFKTRISERGEHCAYLSFGSVEIKIAATAGQEEKTALFPVCLKKASLVATGQNIRATVSDDQTWLFNPVLKTHLQNFGIRVLEPLIENANPVELLNWVKSQLTNRAARIDPVGYIGLFSSQQMVIQERFEDPRLCHVLAKNPVIQAKLEGRQTEVPQVNETTDSGLEDLGMVLPCDDSQLRVVQLSDRQCCLQVEGPPGTGKSQTIANIISNALWRGRSVLLVCDKKAAINQVEERLADAGLKPAMINLHDEDLDDKKKFLRQATERFSTVGTPIQYPFGQLSQTREILNDRVRFGRKICHPAMQVSNFEALGGMVQLKRELSGNVPPLDITNWQAISSDRLTPLLQAIAGWPGFAAVITDSTSLWNRLRTEAFINNPNVEYDLNNLGQKILGQLEQLNELREMTSSVGADTKLTSDADTDAMLRLAEVVLRRPNCHHEIVGNKEVTLSELSDLQIVWLRKEELIKARHPVPLGTIYPVEAEQEAKYILDIEKCATWQQMSDGIESHDSQREKLEATQPAYRRLCDQLGLIYSPLLKFRRAQLEAVMRLGSLQCSIPQSWWSQKSTPVHSVTGWTGQFRACGQQAVNALSPIHFLALERVAGTHWEHVEAKAEHGFNLVSYCLKFVNDRKCKFALSQVYPGIPARGFKRWQELTLHAISTHRIVRSLRDVSDTHVVLRQITANYLATGHEHPEKFNEMLAHEDVKRLEAAAALVEQLRNRNDLFDIAGVHWQALWETPNPRLVGEAQALLSKFDNLVFPDCQSDDVEVAIRLHQSASRRLSAYLQKWEQGNGDRTQSVLTGIAAQRQYAACNEKLKRLNHYEGLNKQGLQSPDWEFLKESITWRDHFEELCGTQRLDIDRKIWNDIASRLQEHKASLSAAYGRMNLYFEKSSDSFKDYNSLIGVVEEILAGLPLYQLWLEKKKWQEKIRGAYPELFSLWNKVIGGSVKPEHAKRLFCFNLLRLCSPIAKPDGSELRQTLQTFIEQDERLTEWTIKDLQRKLQSRMQRAEVEHPAAHGRLRHLAGLQKLPAFRTMLNNNVNYDTLSFLLKSKPCWLMSPTSLANLIDLSIFENGRAPFDLVIFDEASQIRVLDGLLSMSFGTQVIVVGDKKQLPPTDFFASFANPDGDDDSIDSAISESLLDEFTGQLHDEMLMSHYRSETPDLIRFSNDWFYSDETGKGRLELYPPAHVTGAGRRLHYVKNAFFSESAGQRSNRREAEEVVSLIGAHVRDFPDKSLGVVTMNIPQMELIEELVQNAPQSVQAFCSDDVRFFLRNLETVQGDEMDRIIVSLTYGKRSAESQFNAATLGPLLKKGGERRLNVAITRSRSGMIIVSSLTTADLASSGATSEGFRCFKAFLQDLEMAQNVSNFGITNQRFQKRNNGVSNLVFCDSPFEEQVVDFLENQGITEIECQYGCGKFRIDIVVKERGKNLLAIECDGASYHSSLVARTRDRARQRILESRGWRGRIHRVWSTNWWHFEAQEKQAILAAISEARHAHRNTGSRSQAAPPSPPPALSISNHFSQDIEEPNDSDVDIIVDDAGNVLEAGSRENPPLPRFSQREQSTPVPQLEPRKIIGGVSVSERELLNALYQFIPANKEILREELLEKVSQKLGVPLKKARSELNHLISKEKSSGRLDVTQGSWTNVWRTRNHHG